MTNKSDKPLTDHEPSFNFDLERMTEAVNSPMIEMPEGLTREEKREFITNACKVPKIKSLEDFDAWLNMKYDCDTIRQTNTKDRN